MSFVDGKQNQICPKITTKHLYIFFKTLALVAYKHNLPQVLHLFLFLMGSGVH